MEEVLIAETSEQVASSKCLRRPASCGKIIRELRGHGDQRPATIAKSEDNMMRYQ